MSASSRSETALQVIVVIVAVILVAIYMVLMIGFMVLSVFARLLFGSHVGGR